MEIALAVLAVISIVTASYLANRTYELKQDVSHWKECYINALEEMQELEQALEDSYAK